jgi:hypothetical protein
MSKSKIAQKAPFVMEVTPGNGALAEKAKVNPIVMDRTKDQGLPQT